MGGYEHDSYHDNALAVQDGAMGMEGDASQGDWQYQTNWDYSQQPAPAFQCEHCEKKFASNQSLSNHLPVHTGKTTCNLCGKVESTRSNLSRHLKMAHNNLIEFT